MKIIPAFSVFMIALVLLSGCSGPPETIPTGSWAFRATPVDVATADASVDFDAACADNFECQFGDPIGIEADTLDKTGLSKEWFGDFWREDDQRTCVLSEPTIGPGTIAAESNCVRAVVEEKWGDASRMVLAGTFDANGYRGRVTIYWENNDYKIVFRRIILVDGKRM